MLAKPLGHAAPPPAEDPLALEMFEPSLVTGASIGRRDGDQVGHGPITLEDHDRATPFDVRQVPRETILELADLGLHHVAKLATFHRPVNVREPIRARRYALRIRS